MCFSLGVPDRCLLKCLGLGLSGRVANTDATIIGLLQDPTSPTLETEAPLRSIQDKNSVCEWYRRSMGDIVI